VVESRGFRAALHCTASSTRGVRKVLGKLGSGEGEGEGLEPAVGGGGGVSI
jgi:hypothetical protein